MTPAADLLAWYRASGRDLPWRHTRDPYRILVSEVMLQQTRVETVLSYYQRFLARFPTLGRLAEAEEEEVLAAWSGLGYYRRARALHRTARTLIAAGRELPRSAAGLEALPGIGPYTAAAVASIAFGEQVAVVDGNVARVVSRWLASRAAPATSRGRAELAAAALNLLVPGHAGDGNQALMELGATVCTPRRPRCESCPLAVGCRAHRAGETALFPVPRRRPESVRESLLVALVEEGGHLLLFRRSPGESLLGGLWELPWSPAPKRGGHARALADRYGGGWQVSPPLVRVSHRITRHDLEIEVRRARHQPPAGEVAEGPEAAWVRPEELEHWPVGGLVGKVLAAARSGAGPRGCRARRRRGCTR